MSNNQNIISSKNYPDTSGSGAEPDSSGSCCFKPTYIYVDGFNLYYRALKGTSNKWLDLKKLAQCLLNSSHKIIKIKYFTARVQVRENNNGSSLRQDIYIKALQKYIPEIELVYGTFKTRVKKARKYPPIPENYVKVYKTEEKGSDVNLAVHLVNDAWLNKYECAVVISNDSDLAEAMNIVKNQRNKLVGLFMPDSKQAHKSLVDNSHFQKNIRIGVLKKSQLPETIPDTKIRKPLEWY